MDWTQYLIMGVVVALAGYILFRYVIGRFHEATPTMLKPKTKTDDEPPF